MGKNITKHERQIILKTVHSYRCCDLGLRAVLKDIALLFSLSCECAGKLCLQNERVAKLCVPALARELEVSSDDSVRNNVIVVMCDLCVRSVFTFIGSNRTVAE